jgi:predicted nucleic acid-binding protein
MTTSERNCYLELAVSGKAECIVNRNIVRQDLRGFIVQMHRESST